MPDTIKGAPAAELTARHIEDLILDGALRPGDALLSEREMAAELEVSRPTLRQALKLLEEKGLLRPMTGGGREVAPLATSVTDPLMALLDTRSEVVEDYLELRGVLERMASSLAAKRATDIDRNNLTACAERINTAFEQNDPEAEAEADIALHLTVYEASHNVVLLQIMQALSDMLRKGVLLNRGKLYAMPEVRGVLRDQHLRIIDTILAGDVTAAGEAAETHVSYTQLALAEIAAAEARLEKSLRRIEGGKLGQISRGAGKG